MMWLVACGARAWKRHGGDHPAIIVRMLVEVDYGKEVRIGACLVAGPDEEVFLVLVIGAHNMVRAGEQQHAGAKERGRGYESLSH